MKPYIYKNTYKGVFELKSKQTVFNKKSKRQESKKVIKEQLQEHIERYDEFDDVEYK